MQPASSSVIVTTTQLTAFIGRYNMADSALVAPDAAEITPG
jgi:hypothetical protein